MKSTFGKPDFSLYAAKALDIDGKQRSLYVLWRKACFTIISDNVRLDGFVEFVAVKEEDMRRNVAFAVQLRAIVRAFTRRRFYVPLFRDGCGLMADLICSHRDGRSTTIAA